MKQRICRQHFRTAMPPKGQHWKPSGLIRAIFSFERAPSIWENFDYRGISDIPALYISHLAEHPNIEPVPSKYEAQIPLRTALQQLKAHTDRSYFKQALRSVDNNVAVMPNFFDEISESMHAQHFDLPDFDTQIMKIHDIGEPQCRQKTKGAILTSKTPG